MKIRSPVATLCFCSMTAMMVPGDGLGFSLRRKSEKVLHLND